MLLITPATTFARARAEPPFEVETQLRELLADHLARSAGVHGEALFVQTQDWAWSGAIGTSDGKTTRLTPGHVFRIASVTKPFTAAAILRLMEEGKVDISRPISGYISPGSTAALRKGGYDPDVITVQQLLSHTSGIFDYATDPAFVQKVMVDPAHQWTRGEQIEHAMVHGRPIDTPGRTYAYSDTGYILLGEIIERRTGVDLPRAVRVLLRLDRLGLRNTWWEQLENPRSSAPVAPNFYGPLNLASANPSFDLYGGGGMISSVGDLTRFYRALVRGELFDDPRTLAVLLTVTNARRPPQDRGVHNNALQLIEVGRYHCWGHSGFWGQLVAYCPEIDLTFAWTINQAIRKREAANDFLSSLATVASP